MRTISTNNLSGQKRNTDVLEIKKQLEEKNKKLSLDNLLNKPQESLKSDIFSRLQAKNKKTVHLVNNRLKTEKEKEIDIHKIHRKTISKDLLNRLGRKPKELENEASEELEEEKVDVDDDESNRSISQEASFEEEVKHSAPEIVKDTSNGTILIKNLPDIMYTSKLKALFKDETSIVGHTIEKGTAEVIFSSKEGAEQAIKNVNGRNYLGKVLVAQFVNEGAKNIVAETGQKVANGEARGKTTESRKEEIFNGKEEIFNGKEERPKEKQENKTSSIRRAEIPNNKMIIDNIETTGIDQQQAKGKEVVKKEAFDHSFKDIIL